MPSVTLPFGPGGPLISVLIGPSSPRQAAMTAAGVVVPPPVQGMFLIDTGASNTVVDAAFVAPLGLTPTGTIMCHTPSTGTTAMPFNQYDVLLFIPGPAGGLGWMIEAQPVMESDFAAQGIQGLIGRDVLDKAVLIYNGTSQHFTLSW